MTINLLASNVFLSAYSQSDFFGKLIFLGLFLLSVICWIVLLQKAWVTRHVRRISAAFQMAVEQTKRPIFSLDVSDLPKPHLRSLPHPFAQIFATLKQKALELLNKNHYFATNKGADESAPVYLSPKDLELLETHVMTTISSQTKILERHLYVLSTIVTLAPFLGLLGTVWGILITFAELHGGASASSNAAILGGLSTALATTVLGLVIAIPALISYNYLRNAMRNLNSDMDDFLSLLLSTVEIQYRKVE
jgi:biopolymer transport protein TolQ